MSELAPTASSGLAAAARRLSLVETKLRAQVRMDEEKEHARLKRDVIVLILDFLAQSGYVDTLQRMQSETGLFLQKWQAADNIDLRVIVQEFEAFFKIKHGKVPKLVRRTNPGEDMEERGGGGAMRQAQVPGAPRPPPRQPSPATPQAGGDAAAVSEAPKFGRRASGAAPASAGPHGQQQTGGGAGASAGAGAGAGGQGQQGAGLGLDEAIVGSGVRGASGKPPAGAGTGAAAGKQVQARSQQQQQQQPQQSGAAAAAAAVGAGARMSGGISAARLNGEHVHLDGNLNPHVTGSAASGAVHARGKTGAAAPAVSGGAYARGGGDGSDSDSGEGWSDMRVARPLNGLQYTGQLREVAEMIQRDIFTENPKVKFSDIVGLEQAKQLVQESIIFPMRYPAIFTGILSPWKGILLYGPPGVGKTLMAKAIATECRTTFFNISASSIVSKYRGDSEKLVRVLFEMARYYAPSTIFLDEIDSIMGTRDASGEHEASRRMKTELLVQMDGLIKGGGGGAGDDPEGGGGAGPQVFVLAASNHPWHLDVALLRRLEKRILVPLPDEPAREALLRSSLVDGRNAAGLDYAELARKTRDYSGSDIVLLCKEAAMRPVRRLMAQLQKTATSSSAAAAAGPQGGRGGAAGAAGAGAGAAGAGAGAGAASASMTAMGKGSAATSALISMHQDGPVQYPQVDPVRQEDADAALRSTHPSTSVRFLERYTKWANDFGSGHSDFEADGS